MATGETDYSKVVTMADAKQSAMIHMSPREILLELLGKLDRGELDPDVMVISYGYWNDNDERSNGYVAAGADPLAGYGAVYAALNMMSNGR